MRTEFANTFFLSLLQAKGAFMWPRMWCSLSVGYTEICPRLRINKFGVQIESMASLDKNRDLVGSGRQLSLTLALERNWHLVFALNHRSDPTGHQWWFLSNPAKYWLRWCSHYHWNPTACSVSAHLAYNALEKSDSHRCVQFRSIDQSRLTGLPDETKYGPCHMGHW